MAQNIAGEKVGEQRRENDLTDCPERIPDSCEGEPNYKSVHFRPVSLKAAGIGRSAAFPAS